MYQVNQFPEISKKNGLGKVSYQKLTIDLSSHCNDFIMIIWLSSGFWSCMRLTDKTRHFRQGSYQKIIVDISRLMIFS